METISKNIDDLVSFYAVAKEGSFTKGAEALGTSKAMVSKKVKRLEAYMKSQLFIRTTRTLSLTEQGEALFEYSQRIFTLSDEASKRLREMSQGTSGIIRISAPVSLGEIMMPDLLLKAKKILPNVVFEIDLSNDNRDFGKDGIDFALRASEDHHPDLIAKYIGHIKDAVCASHHFVEGSNIGGDPNELKEHSCLLHQDDNWNSWTFSRESKEFRIKVNGKIITNQYPMMRNFCIQGLGVARMPLYIASEDIKKGTLIELYSRYEISTHPLYLVYVRNEFATKKHKITRDLILDWFKSHRHLFTNKLQ